VFVVVREDRHVDTEISVHETLEGANLAIETFKARYDAADGLRYSWLERTYGRDEGWLRYVDAGDDAPHARIESKRVEL
jgi:hypothetical protein